MGNGTLKILFIFSTPMLITHLWQLKTIIFQHGCLIHAVPLETSLQDVYKFENIVEQKFKQKGREEQCEPDDKDKDRAEIVGELLGCDPEAMMKAYCKPKIKVGTEWVTKGQVPMLKTSFSLSTMLRTSQP
jgi:hypothetical protein